MKPLKRFEGKVALLTGAASGLGRATALRFAEEGAGVYGVDIDQAGLVDTKKEVEALGARMEVGQFDISRRALCHEAVAACVAAFGRLDTLANIAGINRFSHFQELSEEEWDLLLGVNLKGTAFMVQAAIPHLLETKGSVVNVASVAGLVGQAYTVAYCASKGGVIQLTKALAMEYVNEGIRVNAIAPGGIDTPMNTGITFPDGMDWKLVERYTGLRGMCDPAEIAGAIAYLASDEARFVHGAVLSIDGGMLAG
jgi:NAD(P)-dependent dehydrogenase (short-subunit alcohol dehydrogenase family)